MTEQSKKLIDINIDEIVNEAKKINLVNDDVNPQEVVHELPEKTAAHGNENDGSHADDVSTVSLEKEQSEHELQADDNIWKIFLQYGEKCKDSNYKGKKKVTWIDEDIVNTFQCCKINKLPVTDMVNSALHAFIDLNKDNLRQYFERKQVLI